MVVPHAQQENISYMQISVIKLTIEIQEHFTDQIILQHKFHFFQQREILHRKYQFVLFILRTSFQFVSLRFVIILLNFKLETIFLVKNYEERFTNLKSKLLSAPVNTSLEWQSFFFHSDVILEDKDFHQIAILVSFRSQKI